MKLKLKFIIVSQDILVIWTRPGQILDVPELVVSFTLPLATHRIAVEIFRDELGNFLGSELHPALTEHSVVLPFLLVILVWLQEDSTNPASIGYFYLGNFLNFYRFGGKDWGNFRVNLSSTNLPNSVKKVVV